MSAAAATEPSESAATDPDCAHCGYNLRALPPGARCPECGLDVVSSTLPAKFHLRSWRDVRRVRRGLALYAACMFAWACLQIGLFLHEYFSTQIGQAGPAVARRYFFAWQTWDYGSAIAECLGGACAAWTLTPLWRFTSRYPRFLARFALVASAVQVILWAGATVFWQMVGFSPYTPHPVLAAIVSLLAAAGAAAVIPLFWLGVTFMIRREAAPRLFLLIAASWIWCRHNRHSTGALLSRRRLRRNQSADAIRQFDLGAILATPADRTRVVARELGGHWNVDSGCPHRAVLRTVATARTDQRTGDKTGQVLVIIRTIQRSLADA